jgi:hypothetical protein
LSRQKITAAMLAAMLMTSCSRGPSALALSATLDEARAFDCVAVCKSVLIGFTVRNGTDQPYCVGGEYGGELVAEHVQVRSSSGRIEGPVRSTGMRPEHPPGPVGLAKSMLDSQNFVVQPRGAQYLRAISSDYFELEPSPSVISLTILAYPCDARALNADTVKTIRISGPLMIQR